MSFLVKDERLTNSFPLGEIPQVDSPALFVQNGKVNIIYTASRVQLRSWRYRDTGDRSRVAWLSTMSGS